MKIKQFILTILGFKNTEQLLKLSQQFELEKTIEAQAVNIQQKLAKNNPQVLQEQELLKKKEKEALDIQADKAKIQKEVDFFIQDNDLVSLNQYLKAGYILATTQLQTICFKTPNWIQKNHASFEALQSKEKLEIEFFQNHLNKNALPQIRELILEGIQSFSTEQQRQKERAKDMADDMYSSMLYRLHKRSYAYFSTGIRQLRFSSFLLQEYGELFQHDVSFFKTYSQELPLLRENLNITKISYDSMGGEYQERFENPGVHYQEFKEAFSSLEQLISRYFQDMKKIALSEKLSLISEIYTPKNTVESLQEELKLNLQDKISGFQKSSLSPEAWVLFESIKKEGNALMLEKNYHSLNDQDKFEVKNLTEKVLIEVLNSYMAILPEHKSHLKNEEGKNVDQLFIESLQKIDNQLKDKSLALAQAQFKDVKVVHQYLKAKM